MANSTLAPTRNKHSTPEQLPGAARTPTDTVHLFLPWQLLSLSLSSHISSHLASPAPGYTFCASPSHTAAWSACHPWQLSCLSTGPCGGRTQHPGQPGSRSAQDSWSRLAPAESQRIRAGHSHLL